MRRSDLDDDDFKMIGSQAVFLPCADVENEFSPFQKRLLDLQSRIVDTRVLLAEVPGKEVRSEEETVRTKPLIDSNCGTTVEQEEIVLEMRSLPLEWSDKFAKKEGFDQVNGKSIFLESVLGKMFGGAGVTPVGDGHESGNDLGRNSGSHKGTDQLFTEGTEGPRTN